MKKITIVHLLNNHRMIWKYVERGMKRWDVEKFLFVQQNKNQTAESYLDAGEK